MTSPTLTTRQSADEPVVAAISPKLVPVLLLVVLTAEFVSLVLAAFDVKVPRVNLGWLGLALWVLSVLIR